jgi:DNA-binding GntR family transcriptional regulator
MRDCIEPGGGMALYGGPAKARSFKADHVYRDLKQAIIDGTFPPGAPIDKDELCSRFKASRSPVTNAINRLAYERLVQVEPQRGSFVAPIFADEIMQFMMLRRALEAEAAAEAAKRGGAALWLTLDRNLLYQRAALQATDHRRFFQLDVEFHQVIVEASGWWTFNHVLEDVHSHVDRARRVLMPLPGHLDLTWDEHAAILEALKQGAPEEAGRAMRHHIDRVARQFQSFANAAAGFPDGAASSSTPAIAGPSAVAVA